MSFNHLRSKKKQSYSTATALESNYRTKTEAEKEPSVSPVVLTAFLTFKLFSSAERFKRRGKKPRLCSTLKLHHYSEYVLLPLTARQNVSEARVQTALLYCPSKPPPG